MKEKTKVLNAVKKINIRQEDWVEDILDMITDRYAKGYVEAKLSELYNSIPSDREDFREEFLEVCENAYE
jgi:hypothetical protein